MVALDANDEEIVLVGCDGVGGALVWGCVHGGIR